MRKSYRILNGFWLKVIAMVTMTIDHIGVYMQMYNYNHQFRTIAPIFRDIGRIAFPIFVFLLAEGMFYTKKPGKYIGRLAIVAGTVLIAHVSVILYFKFTNQYMGSLGGNPIIELVCLASMLYFFKLKGAKKLFSIFPIAYILASFAANYVEDLYNVTVYWMPDFLRADYNLIGLIICLCFYFARPVVNKIASIKQPAGLDLESFQLTEEYRSALNWTSIAFFFSAIFILWLVAKLTSDASGFSYFDPFSISWESYCLLSCIPIALYNGKRGYDSKKWRFFTYSYFPMHLVIICIIFVLIYGI